jgi:hypothetical protein
MAAQHPSARNERAKRLLTVTALLIGLAAAIPINAGDRERWYAAHIGPEACVPLEDIGNNGERLYYGAGQFQTPEDFVRHVKSQGGTITRRPGIKSGARVYDLKFRSQFGIQTTEFVFFNDLDMCKTEMAKMDK